MINTSPSQGQVAKNSKDSLLNNTRLWNVSFNKHDTDSYYKLIDDEIAITAGRGTQIGAREFQLTTNDSYTYRPDITMYLNRTKVEINERWSPLFSTAIAFFRCINHIYQSTFMYVVADFPEHNTPKSFIYHIFCL